MKFETINRVAEDVNALYYDRLYPAVEMAKITKTLYENRLFLEEYLNLDDESQRKDLLQGIKVNQKIIDSLVRKYEESHLVEEENKNLLAYRKEVFKYRQLENEILQLHKSDAEAAKLLFSTESSEEFKKMIEPIHKITNIQLKIGEELRDDSIKEADAILPRLIHHNGTCTHSIYCLGSLAWICLYERRLMKFMLI
jgi:hypothetical protein